MCGSVPIAAQCSVSPQVTLITIACERLHASVGCGVMHTEASDVVTVGSYGYRQEYLEDLAAGRRMSNRWYTWIGTPLLIVGTLGNLLAFAVLQTRSFRQAPSGFILSLLALVDIGVLSGGLLRHVIMGITADATDISISSSGGCKVYRFSVYFLTQLSAWTLVLMTIERLLSVLVPMKTRQLCSKKRISIGWAIVIAILVIANGHVFFTVDLQDSLRVTSDAQVVATQTCHYLPDYSWFWKYIWPWIDLVLACLLSGSIILVTNITIAVKIRHAKKVRQMRMRVQGQENDAKTRSITAMLLSISFLFLLTNAPIAIFLIGYNYWNQDTAEEQNRLQAAELAVNLIMYSNNAFNFLMYCVSGAKFRKALVMFVCCRDPRLERRFSTTSTSLHSLHTTNGSVRSVMYMRNLSTNSNTPLVH